MWKLLLIAALVLQPITAVADLIQPFSQFYSVEIAAHESTDSRTIRLYERASVPVTRTYSGTFWVTGSAQGEITPNQVSLGWSHVADPQTRFQDAPVGGRSYGAEMVSEITFRPLQETMVVQTVFECNHTWEFFTLLYDVDTRENVLIPIDGSVGNRLLTFDLSHVYTLTVRSKDIIWGGGSVDRYNENGEPYTRGLFTLVAVPEPASWALLLIGLVGLKWRNLRSTWLPRLR